jgi:transcriptional regulator with XRE-family HTH domain
LVQLAGTKKNITPPVLTHGTNLVYCAVMTSQQVSTDFNQRVGANIQRLRKEKGMSQADLARELTARGYSFQHQGILKIEKGVRPLKAEEFIAVAEVLHVNPGMLSDAPAEAAFAATQLHNAMAALTEIQQQMIELERDRGRYERLRQEAEDRLLATGATKNAKGQWWWHGEH